MAFSLQVPFFNAFTLYFLTLHTFLVVVFHDNRTPCLVFFANSADLPFFSFAAGLAAVCAVGVGVTVGSAGGVGVTGGSTGGVGVVVSVGVSVGDGDGSVAAVNLSTVTTIPCHGQSFTQSAWYTTTVSKVMVRV